MLTARAVAALTDLVREYRRDWHQPGIRAALHEADREGHSAFDITAALIHRAADPNNRTPQLQPADFRPPPEARCPVGASGCWPHGLCAGCQVASGTLVEPVPAWSEQPWSDTARRSLLAITGNDHVVMGVSDDPQVCLREVEVTTATASGIGAWYDRPPEPHVLCLRPLPCDNPNHKPDSTGSVNVRTAS